jgi:hypothetical protein
MKLEIALPLDIMRATWPDWLITPGPTWWACRRERLVVEQRTAGLRELIGRPCAVELGRELMAEDRAARRLARASP